MVGDVSRKVISRVTGRGNCHDPRGRRRFSPFLFSTLRVLGRGRRKMLPKPIEKTRRAIVSEASTARLVFEMGLSVADKGWCPGARIFSVFGIFLWRFRIIFCRF